MLTPANGAYLRSADVVVTGAITEDSSGSPQPGIGRDLVVYLGGTEKGRCTTFETASGTAECSVLLMSLMDGSYSLQVASAYQSLLGQKSIARTFTVDLIAPAKPVVTKLVDVVGGATVEKDAVDGVAVQTATPGVKGTAEAESKVKVVVQRTDVTATAMVLPDVTVAANGSWSANVPTLAAGKYSLTVAATDKAGNTGPAAGLSFVVDLNAPALAVNTVEGKSFSTSPEVNTRAPLIEGTAEAGVEVRVELSHPSLGSPVVLTTVANGSTLWSVIPGTDLVNEGLYTLTVTAKDASGRTTPVTGKSFTLDMQAPNKPVVTKLVDVTGEKDAVDGVAVQTATPGVKGTAEAGSTVKVVVQRKDVVVAPLVLGDVTAAGDTTWSVNVPALAEGKYSLTATATDKAGNISQAAALFFAVDLNAPSLAVNTVEGKSFSTSPEVNTRAPLIEGTAEAGAEVRVELSHPSLGSPVVLTTVANGSTLWSVIPGTDLVNEGLYTLTVTAKDASGRTTPVTGKSFTLDMQAPNKPVLTKVVDVVGGSPMDRDAVDGVAVQTAAPGVKGTAEAGSTVKVVVQRKDVAAAPMVLGDVTAAGDTTWSVTMPTLAEGRYALTVTATDKAGNTSQAAALFLVVDLTSPAAPELLSIAGKPAVDEMRINTATPAIRGLAEAGSTVTVNGLGSALSDVVDAAGAWSVQPSASLAEGRYTLVVTVADTAGNASASRNLSFTVDLTRPGVPVVTYIDGRAVDGAALVINTQKPLIEGTSEAGSTVEIKFFQGSSTSGTPALTLVTTTDSKGDWSVGPTSNLAQILYTIEVRATDMAGNASSGAATVSFTVNTTVPDPPEVLSIGGQPARNGLRINTPKPRIAGSKAALGSTVNVEIGGLTTPLTAMAAEDGSWAVESTDVPLLADNTYTLRVTVTTSSGSVSDDFTLSFTVDTSAPVAPELSRVAERLASNGMRINKANPIISGTSEARSQVTVTISGLGALTPVDADGAGAWSVAPITALAEGDYTVTVTAKDEAGNPSEASQPLSFTVDRTPPASPVVQKIAGKAFATDVLLNTARPHAEGMAEPAGQVLFFLGEEKERIGAVTANSDGTWRLPLDQLSEGPFQEYSLFFQVKDQAGNDSDYLGPIHLIIDTVAPEITVSGPPKSSLVNNAVFVFTSSEDGTRIECKLDTASTFENCGNEKSFSDLAEGTRVLQVRGVDQAGNVSDLTTYDWQVYLGGDTHAIGGGLSCSTAKGGESSLGLLALLGLGVLASRRRAV